MGYIRDEYLEFLKDVNSNDLNKLVEILIKTKTEELTKKDIYKEFKDNPNIYWEEIVAELQHFGGNTVANIARGKGVKYSEILKDVCKSFDIKLEFENPILDFDNNVLSKVVTKVVDKVTKFNQKSVQDLEKELLTKFTESELNKAIKECNSKTKLKDKDLLLLLLPFGLPQLVLKRLSDPNFQVTAQAIYEVAKLREKYNSQPKLLDLEYSKNKNLEFVYSERLTIVDDKDTKLGELKIIDQTSISEIELKDSKQGEIDRISHFISDAFKGVISTSNQTVELVFSSEVQKELAKVNGKYKRVIDSAIARNRNGTIKEHGKIIQSGQGKQLLTGGYQLLSIAVAQSHLADIEKSLSSIKSLVQNIQDKLEAEDRANLKGAIRYLENKIIPLIKNYDGQNEIGQEYKNEFQSIIRDIYTWEDKFLEEFEILNKEIQQLKSKDTFGTGNTYEELKTLLKRIEPLKERYGLILKLSNILNVVQKFIYFNEKNVLNIDIQLEPFKDLMDKYNKFIDGKKELLESKFNKNDTLSERKKVIGILQDKQNSDFEKFTFEYQKQSQSIDEYFENFKNGKASIILSFDDKSNVDKYAINYQ